MHRIHKFVIQLCKQSDCESEKLKRKIDFSESLTVLGHTHCIQNSVILRIYMERHIRCSVGGWLLQIILLLIQRMNILSILCIMQLILTDALRKKKAEITEIQTHLYPAFEMTIFNKYVSYLKCSFQTSDACDFLD